MGVEEKQTSTSASALSRPRSLRRWGFAASPRRATPRPSSGPQARGRKRAPHPPRNPGGRPGPGTRVRPDPAPPASPDPGRARAPRASAAPRVGQRLRPTRGPEQRSSPTRGPPHPPSGMRGTRVPATGPPRPTSSRIVWFPGLTLAVLSALPRAGSGCCLQAKAAHTHTRAGTGGRGPGVAGRSRRQHQVTTDPGHASALRAPGAGGAPGLGSRPAA